jgi:Family of unknown function (DUF5824)
MEQRHRTQKQKQKKKFFWPLKYYKGLTRKQGQERKKFFQKQGAKSWKNASAYREPKTNKLGVSKSSKYTQKWHALFPNVKAMSLKEKAKATGVPLKQIKESYNRGMAAWRTGHRPFASQQQWGHARVSSFLLCGKTYHTTDSDLVRKAKQSSVSAKKWWSKQKECIQTKKNKATV